VRRLPLLLAVFAGLCVLAPPAGAGPAKNRVKKPARASVLQPVTGPLQATIGIAEQKPSVFADRRFRRLGLRHARRSVAWDTMLYDWQVADVDAWMLAARRAGVSPLITFARSRISERRHVVPTVAQIRRAFKAFRERYPWTKDFVASNESNHYGEPTGRRPKLAVQYYKAMRRACPDCRIAAATLVDYPNLVKWSQAFIKAAKEQPRYWALHNYVGANRFDVKRTRRFLLTVKGDVWITEVGGAVRRPRGQAKFEEGIGHAARVTRFIFDGLARLSPRITRIYLSHWSAGGPGSTWDSALVSAGGRPRPALTVVEKVLKDIRVASKACPKRSSSSTSRTTSRRAARSLCPKATRSPDGCRSSSTRTASTSSSPPGTGIRPTTDPSSSKAGSGLPTASRERRAPSCTRASRATAST
jgi:hypothetical protein